MTASSSTAEEPTFTIPRPPRFWRGLGVLFVVAACLVVLGGSLFVARSLRQPAEPIITLNGIMASKQDFFNDEQVQQILLDHHIRVEVTARGSREVALEVINQKTEQYDFAFPSGQPAANMIMNQRSATGAYHRETRLFTSPIVLASFREYAEVLVDNDVAVPYPGQEKPLYYTLDLAKLIDLGERGATWNSIQVDKQKRITNGNKVLARTSGVCRANSAATYLGLLAFVKNGGKAPVSENDVDRLAEQIRPLISIGLTESDLFESYVTPDGRSKGPVVVVYEHQFLAHQINHQQRTHTQDTDRVLLYPKEEFQTDPELISLKPGGADRLAELLAKDPALRARMLELGYRVLDGDRDTVGTGQLFEYLIAHGIPAPQRTDFTRADLPNLDLLERLIHAVDRCPA